MRFEIIQLKPLFDYFQMAVDRVTQVEPRRIMVDKSVPAAAPPAVIQQQQPMIVQQQMPAGQQPVIIERAFKQTTTKRRIENDTSEAR